ncbi:MAG: helix-turn-helix transcriptional regulator [Solirubrobacterales bacterium]
MARPRRNMRSEALAIKFGQNLRRCRRFAELSQEELGERASLHRTEIGMLEHGQRVARIDTLIRLAGAMAIPPGDLLEGIHWSVGDQRRKGSFSFTEPRERGQRRNG